MSEADERKATQEEEKATQTVLEVICRHRNRLSDLIERDDEVIKYLRSVLKEEANELSLARKIVHEAGLATRGIGAPPPGSLGTPTEPPLGN